MGEKLLYSNYVMNIYSMRRIKLINIQREERGKRKEEREKLERKVREKSVGENIWGKKVTFYNIYLYLYNI